MDLGVTVSPSRREVNRLGIAVSGQLAAVMVEATDRDRSL